MFEYGKPRELKLLWTEFDEGVYGGKPVRIFSAADIAIHHNMFNQRRPFWIALSILWKMDSQLIRQSRESFYKNKPQQVAFLLFEG